VSTLTLPKAIREVEALRKLDVDAVIVGLHWGKEYSHEPRTG
jgi:poly-gamma-glutamate capsule biosynthesis protein CapA/YwtB (metallophosphatase superfamily)